MLSKLFRSPVSHLCKRSFASVAGLDTKNVTLLSRDTNQVQGLAEFAQHFMDGALGNGPDSSVLKRTELFHIDSVLCGLSALAMQCNAPTVLQHEALEYTFEGGATCFGSDITVRPEKAVLANASAVREWDSNGTVFGYNKALGPKFQAGEFGHNDFYPVVIAAAQMRGLDGATSLRAMLLLDEIRGRLSEVFSLKSYKIDHVVHGAIASAVVYGTLLGATVEQIESAVGMVVAHYIPFRAIRAGHQLSDSKGASAAISSEMAILSVHRAMRGFVGPLDIFRNPQAIFRLFEPTTSDNESPFDIALTHSGDDFSIMGMHFKLGLYEHQSAGAIQALIDALRQNPDIASSADNLQELAISIYEPAFSIIGEPAKRSPTTRQSADHSMVYIISSVLRRAIEVGPDRLRELNGDNDAFWKTLMLLPQDYNDVGGENASIYNPITRSLMTKVAFEHGGPEYDQRYPEGIPTKLTVTTNKGESYASDMVMFPSGHARNTTCDLEGILHHKWTELSAIAFGEESRSTSEDIIHSKVANIANRSAEEVADMYNLPYKTRTWGSL